MAFWASVSLIALDPDTAPDTLLACYLMCCTPFPKITYQETSLLNDNTKMDPAQPSIKMLACPSHWKNLHFGRDSTEGENSIEKVSLSRRLSGNV